MRAKNEQQTRKMEYVSGHRSSILAVVRSRTGYLLLPFYFLLFHSCQKIEYTTVENPAYLRVFNSLNTKESFSSEKEPYLCMLINPVYDEWGVPVSADIVGDFLDQRDTYAPPYPSHIGVSTTVDNPEYPGKEVVPVGPMLNGFDLSTWAQVPSGEKHIVFYYRPRNEVSFFDLSDARKQDKAVERYLEIKEGEVYTLHVLEKDFDTRELTILLREENFHRLPLSDSLVYVNFYNYSAKGFWQASADRKFLAGQNPRDFFEQGLRDTMNVYLTLYAGDTTLSPPSTGVMYYYNEKQIASDAFHGKYLTTMHRSTESANVALYSSFPLHLTGASDGVQSWLYQGFHFLRPVREPMEDFSLYGQGIVTQTGYGTFYSRYDNGSNLALLYCTYNPYHYESSQVYGNDFMPNLIITTWSGTDNPRSFATVNTLEVINGKVYLTQIQRRYAPPTY